MGMDGVSTPLWDQPKNKANNLVFLKYCQNCSNQFEVLDKDLEFYKKIKVPPPTFCPECRMQRRLAWRNERGLHQRNCDLCNKKIIATYPTATPFPVYCPSCWYSDKWEATSYGRDYDFSRPFFTQFKELQNMVPRISLQVDNSVNCDYTNQIGNCRNCYLITSSSDDEDCLYSHRLLHCNNVTDSLMVSYGENCYQAINSIASSQLIFSENISDCFGLSFCYDMRGSQDGFMSSNKRHASFYFENTPCNKGDFLHKIRGVDTGSYVKLEHYKYEFAKLKMASLHRFADIQNGVNVSGQTILNAKNCHHCFSAGNVENCGYSLFLNDAKDSYDINHGCCTMEQGYEVCTMGTKSARVKFSIDAWPEVMDIEYSDSCRNGSRDLFGCISLRHKQYCILNKQYTKSEYNSLVQKIMAQMDEMPYVSSEKDKDVVYKYGEFFPAELSPFSYNESVAYDYFPLSHEEIIRRGYKWGESVTRNYKVTVTTGKIPDHIKDVPDSILKETIACEHGGKCNSEQCTTAFRLIPAELEFYHKMNLPIPRLCANCRHSQRLKQTTPPRLWSRKCMCRGEKSEHSHYVNKVNHFHGILHCPNEFMTSYSPDRKEIVYCEACYRSEVV